MATSKANAQEGALDPALPQKKRARRRLVGAAALCVTAAIVVPLVLDSEPRKPIDDIQVQIPSRETPVSARNAPAVAGPEQRAEGKVQPKVEGKAQASAEPKAEPKPELKAETRPETKPAPKAETRADSKPAPKAETKADSKPAPKAEPKSETKVAAAAPARVEAKPDARAEPKVDSKSETKTESKPDTKAETKPDTKPETKSVAKAEPRVAGRVETSADTKPVDPKVAAKKYSLQVGAYSSEKAATDQVEKLRKAGLKVFTEKVQTGQGERIRVRVGPYDTRDAANTARDQLKADGIETALITP